MKIKGIMGITGASLVLALAAPAWVIAQAQQSPGQQEMQQEQQQQMQREQQQQMQREQQQQQMPFQQVDQNQDGFVDQNEAQQAQIDQQQFQQADQDGDTRLDQNEYQTAMGMSAQDQQMTQQQQGDSQLMSMTAEELNGMSIVTQQGDTLGEVERVAIDQQTQQPHVVLNVGGFLGLGGEQVAIPVSELQLQGEQLVASGISSTDQLRQQPQYAYQEEDFQEVEGSQQLSQVASGQQGQQQASFQQLDQDGDGYVSREEAQQYPPLAENWQDADMNSDDRLDSAEFSAFESQSGQSQPQPGMQQQEPPAGMGQQQPDQPSPQQTQ